MADKNEKTPVSQQVAEQMYKLYWDSSYSEFCKILNLKEDSYSSERFTALSSIGNALQLLTPSMIGKVITDDKLKIPSGDIQRGTLVEELNIIVNTLKSEQSKVSASPVLARSYAIAITQLELVIGFVNTYVLSSRGL